MDKLYETPDEKYQSMRDVITDNCLSKFKNHDFLGKLTLTPRNDGGDVKDDRTLTKYSYSETFHLA